MKDTDCLVVLQTWLVILQNLATGRSPDTTLSRRVGLFLSLRLTYKERILLLYAALVFPLSCRTALSIAFARVKSCSEAVEEACQKLRQETIITNSRAPESKANASYSNSMHLSRVLSPVTLILMPSLLEVRRSDLELDADMLGVVGVDGDADPAFNVDVRRGTDDWRRRRRRMSRSHDTRT